MAGAMQSLKERSKQLAAFVRAIVPEQAELMPESVAFASLWEDI